MHTGQEQGKRCRIGAVRQPIFCGGVAIRTLQPIDATSIVNLTFRLPGTTEDVEAAGRVAWTDRQLLVGVQFDALPDAAERAIDALME